MHWRYEDLQNLPVEVYDVLVEELNEEAKRQAPEGTFEDWPEN